MLMGRALAYLRFAIRRGRKSPKNVKKSLMTASFCYAVGELGNQIESSSVVVMCGSHIMGAE